MKFNFVSVIVPTFLGDSYIYKVPKHLDEFLAIGSLVLVPFGKKLVNGIVIEFIEQIEKKYVIKEIISLENDNPILLKKHIEFWKYISKYYMCKMGEVMLSSLTPLFKNISENYIVLKKDFDTSLLNNETDILIYEKLLKVKNYKIKDLYKLTKKKGNNKLINSLQKMGMIETREMIETKSIPKFVKVIECPYLKTSQENQKNILNKISENAEYLVHFQKIISHFKKENLNFILKKDLSNLVGGINIINKFIKKEILIEKQIEIDGFDTKLENTNLDYELNIRQNEAFESIKKYFEKEKTFLLYGVTSSGKTEIYLKLIKEIISKDKQVLILLPEIALTTILISRINSYFGKNMVVYHSKNDDKTRAEIWLKVLNKQIQVIVGTRSSIFLPFNDLGLIVVDEEHDKSYKQNDSAPYYNAKYLSIACQKFYNNKTLLVSATPSLEPYYSAISGKIGFFHLSERYSKVELPNIIISDIRNAHKNSANAKFMGMELLENIDKALKQHKQIILFQNRRGYSKYKQCTFCGWVPKCSQCDVGLVFHKNEYILKCHFCGYKLNPKIKCEECGNIEFYERGIGTEKIEEDILKIFPKSRVIRMDSDALRKRHSIDKILNKIKNKEVDILVGTIMITKGFDFDNVSLVGVISADSIINYPDFRSKELAIQTMMQVAGRAGRRNEIGNVIIQTFNPNLKLFEHLVKNDYNAFCNEELKERAEMLYPPFSKLIQIQLKNNSLVNLEDESTIIGNKLKEILNKRVLGPEFNIIPRIKNYYIKNILIKLELNILHNKVKEKIIEIIEDLKLDKKIKSSRIQINVDP